ncbi:nucleoid-associated protein [Stutzerimonas stutzeri]|uniref:Nucleoid-associated protein n=1 Tax=Stutzerimonas stutzeri TaxID=316 RepID=A0A6I6LLK9_STUST|nr:nucleoid-associated protein [Stutzerimonas stutzeri]QGZ31474.1 nucleoid-associated protein [Stutzerimonas stutzeri]
MAFELKHAVIHSFEKEQYSTEVDLKTIVKKPLFDVSLPTVQSLVSGIHTILGKPGNNVAWGQFAQTGRQGPFPATANSFVSSYDAAAFELLTHVALDELVEQAKQETLATGGHTLFASYIYNSVSFLLIANIKQRSGLRLGDDYVPIESVDIDMSKVQQAARINMARLSEAINATENPDEGDTPEENPDDPIDKTYLCFVSKGRDSEASAYFINALGCTPGIASSRATNNAIDAVEDFFREDESLRSYALQAKENVIAYLQKKLEDLGDGTGNGKATLRGVQQAAASAIPAERADLVEALDNLTEHLNNEANQIPEEFSVHSQALNKKIKIKGVSNRWSVQFERGALGTTANSAVWYNKEEGKIILSDISDKLRKLIEAELNKRVS